MILSNTGSAGHIGSTLKAVSRSSPTIIKQLARNLMPNIKRLAAQTAVIVLKQLLVRLKPEDRSWLARHSVSARGNRDVRALVDFSYGTIRGWKNSEFDIQVNGEASLLDRIQRTTPRTVMDVGANIGEWSLAALNSMPGATVHAFEIAPATAAKFVCNSAGYGDRLVINRFGLSDTEGEFTLYYTPESDTASSLMGEAMAVAASNHGITRVEELTVPVTTGDSYMRQRGLSRIDLLKIDVEGAELSVLRGFQTAFDNNLIDLVQFEYGMVNLKIRTFLGDFYDFFSRHGFVVGKLLPHGVGFKPYTLEDEDFIGLNFVACRRDRADLIAAIGCEPLSLDTSRTAAA
jgi:FkbM family methyltransferase